MFFEASPSVTSEAHTYDVVNAPDLSLRTFYEMMIIIIFFLN